jgi:hypothetical protein
MASFPNGRIVLGDIPEHWPTPVLCTIRGYPAQGYFTRWAPAAAAVS